jgi:G6PDH family F420-dependent oxidoreductase
MIRLGYALSSEEHGPAELVGFAQQAEAAGFTFAGISDHFHPWNDEQGQSPFVWTVIGGIAATTGELRLMTGVTCPFRVHPAIVAQAAATAGAMMEGRFLLGLGSGEALNEHVLGARWPSVDVRQEMLEEAIAVIRDLWKGDITSHYGKHFTVEDARIYTLPETPVPIYLAAAGEKAAKMAGRHGDGLIGTAPKRQTVLSFDAAGGGRKPKVGQVHVCWAKSESDARATARRVWPTAAIKGAAKTELPLPGHFEQLAESLTEDQVAAEVVCGPDPRKHIEAIRDYADAGFDHVYVHQVGPDQAGFFDFYKREVLPEFALSNNGVTAARA